VRQAEDFLQLESGFACDAAQLGQHLDLCLTNGGGLKAINGLVVSYRLGSVDKVCVLRMHTRFQCLEFSN
jgi:hypothetical protein